MIGALSELDHQLEQTIQQLEIFSPLQKAMNKHVGHELFFMLVPRFWRSGPGNVSAMACFAGLGGWLVIENLDSIHRLFERMTFGTRNILMTALERKSRSFVVEERRSPLDAVVARLAPLRTFTELVRMRVLVAFAAFFGRFDEVYVRHC